LKTLGPGREEGGREEGGQEMKNVRRRTEERTEERMGGREKEGRGLAGAAAAEGGTGNFVVKSILRILVTHFLEPLI
jgi:hypothetical protein